MLDMALATRMPMSISDVSKRDERHPLQSREGGRVKGRRESKKGKRSQLNGDHSVMKGDEWSEKECVREHTSEKGS